MLTANNFKKLALSSLMAALCGTSLGVLAHTTVRDQATEGTTSYNALQIGHTCAVETNKVGADGNPITKQIPIIAQSVVFPTMNPIVTRPDPNDATKTIPVNLSDVISDATGLAGKADLVQDKNIFASQNEVYDSTGTNLIGFNATRGNLQTNLRGLVPFRFTPPTFVASDANHCAKRLLVKIAIADICKKTFPPKPGTANLWIPGVTTTFTHADIDGVGAPATLTINRKNALDPACGEGYDVTVTPSSEDVDAHLPIKGYWN